jgi:NADH dehydrogenase FAD-containing subunit
VITDQGTIKYDFVIFSPGIDYYYPRYGIDDPADQLELAQKYPGGFMKGTEHVTIKNKIDNFDGGVFLLNVPPGNYRCLPGPYERACMIASIFKKEKVKGKVLLLDANPDVTIKKDGFHAAFDELYKDIIVYKPSTEITGVDLGKKEIKTEFDTIKFDDAAIYPFVRASRLIEACGLMKPKDSQFQANINDETNNLIGDKSVYVTGDSRPMPFSKSANTAQSEAHHIAKVVAARAMGKADPPYESPNTICYSMVNAYPPEAISVNAYYKKGENGSFAFDRVNMVEVRSAEQATLTLEWAKGVYRDMFV